MQSTPSKARTASAIAFYGLAGIVTLAWKLCRWKMIESGAVPGWLVNVMPNFLPAACMPLLVFATPRVVRLRDFLLTALAIGLGLCLYECAQIWLPNRTFDWADLGASMAGAGLAGLAGWLVFFRWLPSEPVSSAALPSNAPQRDSDAR